jgi:hypothetical protein
MGGATVAAMLIALGHGFDLDHPEMQSSFPQRISGALTNILMQPGIGFWDLLGFTPRTTLLEWSAIILNSVVWGVTLARSYFCSLIAKQPSRHDELAGSRSGQQSHGVNE